MNDSEKLHVSWDKVTEMSIQLGKDILLRGNGKHSYTRIVILMRGGTHTGNIVSRILGMKTEQVLAMAISKYDSSQNERAEGAMKLGQIPDAKLVKGQRILLVDDLVRTGDTAAHAEKILKDLGAESVDFAVLFDKSDDYDAKRLPDFYVQKTSAWVEFAWQELDDIYALSA